MGTGSSLEKSSELRLRVMHAVIPFPELVIAECSVDLFQPQNRLAFAFGIGRKANLKPDCLRNADVAFWPEILWRLFAICNLRNVEA